MKTKKQTSMSVNLCGGVYKNHSAEQIAESGFKKLKQDIDTAKQTLSASLYKIKNIEKIEVQFPEIAETLKALKLDVKTKQSKLPSLIDKDVINNIEKLSKI